MTQQQVFQKYYPLLYSIAMGILKSKEDAEDIVQETYSRWLTLDQNKIENQKAYLIQSVKNACLNYIEELKRRRNVLLENWNNQVNEYQEHFELYYSDFEKEMGFRLADMMRKLNAKEQAVYVLRNSFDMSYEDISCIIDTKIDNARKTFQRAKERMLESKTRFEINKEQYKAAFPKFIDAHKNGEVNDYLECVRKQFSQLLK